MSDLSERQKKVLEILLDRYESSKTYIGENRLTQHFRVKPEEIWKAYSDPFTDVNMIYEFERELHELKDRGLVLLAEQKNGEIRSVEALPEEFDRYYELLQRREKRSLESDERELYRKYAQPGTVSGAFAKDQLTLLENGKRPLYKPERAANYLCLLDEITKNESVLYERELSVRVLHDTKEFERSYRDGVCTILRRYGDYEKLLSGETEKRNIQILILEEHQIFTNPEYVFFRGEAEICLKEGETITIPKSVPLALSSEWIEKIDEIQIKVKKIMTIENLTSFHRFDQEDYFCIYLAGYHSVRKTNFFRKIADRTQKEWYHFGDVDPDGFLILRNLCKKTGLSFRPYHMDVQTLEMAKIYAKPLTDKDKRKARKLMEEGYFVEEMKRILKLGIKVEQESIV